VRSTYVPGRSAEEVAKTYGISLDKVIKLGSNENPLGPSPRAVDAIVEHVNEISVYPSPGYAELKDAIARYTGFSSERIVVGNGSDDLLNTFLRSIIEPKDEAIIPVPTYSYYEVIVGGAHGTCVYVRRADDFSIDVDAVIATINDRTKLIIICAPNNPTGNSIEEESLERLLQSTDALVILDEAYAEFASRSHIGLANHFDNLAVFRTFSKAFGLAGLRLGYAVVTPKLARSYEDMQLAFSVNQLAVQAGIAALSDRSFLEKTVATVAEGREFLRDKLPFKTYPTEANFVFVDTAPHTARDVSEFLLSRGIIIRNCETFRGCSNTQVRITVGKPWQNAALLGAVNDFLSTT